MTKTIYSKEHKYITEKLRQARKEAGLDQIQVATRLNRTQSYVSKIESGQRRVDVIQLKKFAEIYKRKIDFFIKK
ncbi:hypothetical protein A3F57_03185 [Candidatus Roizmanbacteria bacterium RIFCSPHIGHO2_12_FULL_36_11]|uniref:HTH cro/C1-type domain-containing protein n=1 Tax=Candidatus Curtissbacteria bacterium RIFCSPLOWO2_01_FULL_37_9 TaxID=1797724 RepID=A0A1F5GUF2_9BACT|nr:MAG: hypothetical protein A3A48_03680 [Candidatus Curtissbacteria bacterium RIFCSPLOWO2_01_FULL_37_9]OGK32566.1 MAG: hypothetical protein A3F57_03185 [Candidatus Roizmanbacteria bacterium RIFCSPHIGHO2_12_FULL_36_11]